MATKTASVLTGGTNSAAVTAEEINALRTDFLSAGIVGAITLNTGSGGTGGFAVNAQASPNMTVRVSLGTAIVAGTPTGGNSQNVRVSMTAFEDVTIAANVSGSTKYDWAYISLDASKLLNPGVNKDDVATLVTSRSSSSATDNGTPPTYGYCLGVVTVANSASSIANSNITDSRIQSGVSTLRGDAVLTQSAAASDSKLYSAGTDANIHLALIPKGNGLVKGAVLRQDDTTNTYQKGNTVMLTGWGVMVPGVATSAAETVTFGLTFAARPIVTISYGGDATSAQTYGSGAATTQAAYAYAHTITTTSFIARVIATGNWAAGNAAFYQWTAIGEI